MISCPWNGVLSERITYLAITADSIAITTVITHQQCLFYLLIAAMYSLHVRLVMECLRCVRCLRPFLPYLFLRPFLSVEFNTAKWLELQQKRKWCISANTRQHEPGPPTMVIICPLLSICCLILVTLIHF